jgi:hypothetical protein
LFNPRFEGLNNMSLSDLLVTETRKLAAWQKAQVVLGYNPQSVRKDRFGSWIQWDQYGKTTPYGWEIDHAVPKNLGGLLSPINEIATQWKNNRTKSDNFIG